MDIIAKIGKNYENLPKILSKYEKEIASAKTHLSLEGKTIGRANEEHSSWQFYYDQKRIELKVLCDYFEREILKTRGKLFKSFSKDRSLALSDRATEKYIDAEDSFLDINELYLQIKEIYLKYDSLVEAFKSRGFSLRNLTELKINSLYDEII